jgi:hypothetical protein
VTGKGVPSSSVNVLALKWVDLYGTGSVNLESKNKQLFHISTTNIIWFRPDS